MQKKLSIIPVRGFPFTIKVTCDPKQELEVLQYLVGGYIEMVRVNKTIGWVDEDGISKELPINRVASETCGMPIRGNMVIEVLP